MRYPETQAGERTPADRKPLTDRAVASLKPKHGARWERFDAGAHRVPGLAIRVGLAGMKSWVLFYRKHVEDASGGFTAGPVQVRWTMGAYPTLTLAAARTKAQDALHELRTKGIDPAEGKREARTGRTFDDLAADYRQRTTRRSWTEVDRILKSKDLETWKTRPLTAITRRDVRDLVNGIVDRGKPVMANRVLALLSAMFNYGIGADWLDGNPAARMPKQPEASRERVLTDAEVLALWTALEAATTIKRVTDKDPAPAVSPMIARGLQMLLLTGQRPGEVFNMRWADVDGPAGWWTIPGQATKNGEPHRVPLTPRAKALLAAAKADGPGHHAFVFAGTMGASVAARAKKAAARLRAADAVTFDFHRHDLRRTVATGMARAGIARDTIAHVLNHVDSGSRVTAIYDRYNYDAEKRTALETWGRRLDAILTGTKERRVVAFTRGRRRRTGARRARSVSARRA